jgi:hypothetical protein
MVFASKRSAGQSLGQFCCSGDDVQRTDNRLTPSLQELEILAIQDIAKASDHVHIGTKHRAPRANPLVSKYRLQKSKVLTADHYSRPEKVVLPSIPAHASEIYHHCTKPTQPSRHLVGGIRQIQLRELRSPQDLVFLIR